MNKWLLVILLFSAFTIDSNAQAKLRYTEFGLGIGTLTSSNDIATTSSVSAILKEIRPNAKIYGMYHVNDWFGLGAEFNYGWIFNDDDNHTNVNRGLEVVTTLSQINLFTEINFIRFGKFHREVKFGMFTRLGAGFTGYNPNLSFKTLKPESITLYPDSYTAANYFISLGFKFRTSYKNVLRVEATFHGLAADNIDGFENTTQFATSANDSYGGVMISYSMIVF
jgi:hypothetical protein